MAIFTGSGVAIVTPMKDNLEVNYDKLEELIDFHVKVARTVSSSPERQARARPYPWKNTET